MKNHITSSILFNEELRFAYFKFLKLLENDKYQCWKFQDDFYFFELQL